MSEQLVCVGCGKRVTVNKYQLRGQEYRCATCRGNNSAKKEEVKVEPSK